jgi:integrase
MFGFARKRGYLPAHQKTAPEQAGTFKEAEAPIEIFTPNEMRRVLAAAPTSLLPLVAIGAFAGIRSVEIQRLKWHDIKWDRGYIEIAGRKAKTAARRLVPLSENLKAWLAPWRNAAGPIITRKSVAEALCDLGRKAKVEGGWKKNALRHSYISYRIALTGDVPRTALEAGNSPEIIHRHYREVVTPEEAREWFGIMPS